MYTLDEIVSEWLEEYGYPENKRRRAYVLGVSGMRELATDTTAIPKITELTISSADTAPLPEDFVNVTKIGLCGPDGRIHSMTADNTICLNQAYNDCGVPIAHTSTIPVGITPFGFPGFIGSPNVMANNYRNGELMGGFFGLGGGQNVNGTYRIDLNRRQIQFGSFPSNTISVVLEYLADINSIDGDFNIHPFMILAVKEWITWRWAIPTGRLGEIDTAHQRYKTARKDTQRRFDSETSQDWLSALRKQNTASVKF